MLMLLITTLESTESTNNYLQDLVSQKKENSENLLPTDIPEFYTVRTNFQTNGKGQKENSWISEPEKNILLSTIIYPKIKAEDQFIINIMITLGILDFCKRTLKSNDLTIKWPNDIYYKDSKLGGVLIEHSVMGNSIIYSILGIGLNINQLIFPKSLPNPVSISQITKQDYNIDQCVRDLLTDISNRYFKIETNLQQLKKEYLHSLYRYKELHLYSINNTKIKATINNVNKYGMLCLTTSESEKLECNFKEISYIL
jgi:BirA family biotin operon repressor/biotin-[acetyl-CoA-carboxylase] ligase